MNRGIIFGHVCYGDGWTGVEAGDPYKGALVTLRHIKSGGTKLKIRYKGEFKTDNNTTMDLSDSEGAFALPFFWSGHHVGNQVGTPNVEYLVSAINPGKGEPGASGYATGRLTLGTDWSMILNRMMAAAAGGAVGKMKSRLWNKAMPKWTKYMAGDYSKLIKAEDLFKKQDVLQNMSIEQYKLAGRCIIHF
ncbi:MAG: hypothetical protein ACI87W_002246 [Halieaceae bacterium]|jgi:hypothetical protein